MKSFIGLCFLLSFIDLSLSKDQINIKAKHGENVTLPCRALKNRRVTALKLTREDLQPQYVLIYRNRRVDKKLQNQQYKNRAKLHSFFSTDEEIHLILKNVTEQDSGKYECRVSYSHRFILERTIHLHVHPPPSPGQGGIGLIVGVTIAVIALIAVIAAIGLYISKKNFCGRGKKIPSITLDI